MEKTRFANVDQYLATFPEDVREILQAVRATILDAVPGAEEVISYQMPMFRLNGWRLHLGGFKKHFSLFVPDSGEMTEALADELAGYQIHKATIKFPLNRPVPIELIRRIATFRIEAYRAESPPARRKRA